jgi:hypothetical protein
MDGFMEFLEQILIEKNLKSGDLKLRKLPKFSGLTRDRVTIQTHAKLLALPCSNTAAPNTYPIILCASALKSFAWRLILTILLSV